MTTSRQKHTDPLPEHRNHTEAIKKRKEATDSRGMTAADLTEAATKALV
jgi:hypothetical protein